MVAEELEVRRLKRVDAKQMTSDWMNIDSPFSVIVALSLNKLESFKFSKLRTASRIIHSLKLVKLVSAQEIVHSRSIYRMHPTFATPRGLKQRNLYCCSSKLCSKTPCMQTWLRTPLMIPNVQCPDPTRNPSNAAMIPRKRPRCGRGYILFVTEHRR